MSRGIRIAAWAALLSTLLCSAAEAIAAAPDPAASAASAASVASAASAASAPPVTASCILVHDKGLLERLLGTKNAKLQTCAQPALKAASQALVGTGDLELVVKKRAYEHAVDWEQDTNHGLLVLYVNGVALTNDAKLVAVEHMGDETHLRYQITQGLESQTMFSSLYRDQGLLGKDYLHVSFGWSVGGPGESYPPRGQDGPSIGITSGLQVGVASGVMAILLAGLLWMGATTDALRDAQTPTWWRDAATLRTQLNAAGANRAQVLSAFEPAYDPKNEAQYVAMAVAALQDGTLPDHPRLIPIGLAIDKGALKPVRASFSLARVQMAVWFAFAICAGLFLWIIYGQLRRIDGSLLALLAISVGTTGASLGTDRNAGGRSYTPSKGLFSDLVTGFDDTQQVHRYQSVIVNLLLLFVGISHVLQQLSYPIFDSTWLALLGVSGVTLGLGKQMLEKPANPPPAGSGGAAASSPAPGPAPAAAASGNAVG